jgi:hypothetical protein
MTDKEKIERLYHQSLAGEETRKLEDFITELSKQFPEVSFAKLSRIAVRTANWQRNQIIDNAVDAVVSMRMMPDAKDFVSFDTNYTDLSFNEGDKVKLIVINNK